MTDALQKAHRWHLVSMDMHEVYHFALAAPEILASRDQLKHWVAPQAYDALMKAAMVAYARGFTRSKSVGNATPIADFEELEISDPRIVHLHKTVLERRHQQIAHSDWVAHNTKIIMQEGDTYARASSLATPWNGIPHTDLKDLSKAVQNEAHRLVRKYQNEVARPPD